MGKVKNVDKGINEGMKALYETIGGNTLRGDVEFKLDGKSYNSKINMRSLNMMTRAEGVELHSLEGVSEPSAVDSMEANVKILYYGCINYNHVVGETQMSMSCEQFSAKLWDNGEELTKALMAVNSVLVGTEGK